MKAGPQKDTLAAILAGERRALARAMSAVENETTAGKVLLHALQPHLGRARVIGITGPPGAGKSTLVNALIGAWLARGASVGVVAVDPSSPFSGGAILGDRIRMGEHQAHERVFIRSLASRGHGGGLSRTAARVVDLLDAAGYDQIMLETVGAGQSEVEVAEIADTRVVVCPPGLGDEVQALKAGILEIADILVVNKCDLPFAERTERELQAMLSLRHHELWTPQVVRTSATSGAGVPALADLIERHGAACASQRRSHGGRVRRLIAASAADWLKRRVETMAGAEIEQLCALVQSGELDYASADLRAIELALRPEYKT
ncbi:MAG: methylmalonyl Co-A mutase-associated GTPase MeaB [Betaproteobacteria bacterium]|nr:MAG: methylmalonyl Co-A mutase-associated GTPase MeaB [Betaproteobacteria bacterium]